MLVYQEGTLPKDLLETVLRARYGNLYALLRDHVSEEWWKGDEGRVPHVLWMASF